MKFKPGNLNTIMKNFIQFIWQYMCRTTEEAKPQFFIFSLLLFTHPLFYVVNHLNNHFFGSSEGRLYENFFLRFIVLLLAVSFILYKFWPKFLLKFTPIFWYFTLLYSLPFFFSFHNLWAKKIIDRDYHLP